MAEAATPAPSPIATPATPRAGNSTAYEGNSVISRKRKGKRSAEVAFSDDATTRDSDGAEVFMGACDWEVADID